MPISTITAKGQVTIPKAIRARLGLREGDKLEFSIDDAGRIVAQQSVCESPQNLETLFNEEIKNVH